MPVMGSINERHGGLAEEVSAGKSPYADYSDPAAERKLVRKLDRHIIPVIMLLYLLSFLDRSVCGRQR